MRAGAARAAGGGRKRDSAPAPVVAIVAANTRRSWPAADNSDYGKRSLNALLSDCVNALYSWCLNAPFRCCCTIRLLVSFIVLLVTGRSSKAGYSNGANKTMESAINRNQSINWPRVISTLRQMPNFNHARARHAAAMAYAAHIRQTLAICAREGGGFWVDGQTRRDALRTLQNARDIRRAFPRLPA